MKRPQNLNRAAALGLFTLVSLSTFSMMGCETATSPTSSSVTPRVGGTWQGVLEGVSELNLEPSCGVGWTFQETRFTLTLRQIGDTLQGSAASADGLSCDVTGIVQERTSIFGGSNGYYMILETNGCTGGCRDLPCGAGGPVALCINELSFSHHLDQRQPTSVNTSAWLQLLGHRAAQDPSHVALFSTTLRLSR